MDPLFKRKLDFLVRLERTKFGILFLLGGILLGLMFYFMKPSTEILTVESGVILTRVFHLTTAGSRYICSIKLDDGIEIKARCDNLCLPGQRVNVVKKSGKNGYDYTVY